MAEHPAPDARLEALGDPDELSWHLRPEDLGCAPSTGASTPPAVAPAPAITPPRVPRPAVAPALAITSPRVPRLAVAPAPAVTPPAVARPVPPAARW